MKTTSIIAFFFALSLGFTSCEDDDMRPANGPDIQISDENLSFDGLNVGETITIPVQVNSDNGVKRISYFFVMSSDNGTETSEAIHFDDSATPVSIQKDLQFEAIPNMLEMVIVAFDSRNVSSEIHISFDNIRSLPQMSFTDNVDYRETVFENKMISVTGTVTSEHDIAALSYKTVVNGENSSEMNIPFSNATNIAFSADVRVIKGLEAIIIEATNIYEGMVVDTFRIGSIVDDAVAITMQNGITEIDRLYAEKTNTFNGMIASGSDVASFSYAIKQDGAYGDEIAIPLGTPLDEFGFSITIEGAESMQAIRLSGENLNGNTLVLELPIERVLLPLVYKQDVVLTTEIGAGKPNWFAAYLEPHVFDQETARTNQEMMDFVFTVHGTALRFHSAAVYEASSYLPTVAPYMEGFTQATYSVVTSNRSSVTTESLAALEYDEDLEKFILEKIMAPTSEGGENYNVAGTNRRTSGNLEANRGLVVGWGSYQDGTAQNEQFAIIFVKEVSLIDGIGHVKFDIKYPSPDYRSQYNPVSIIPYP
ncbi:hypothetical protein [Sunxiuqinia dokdonensis]|uniref:Uncharacterized protein n=1 Tax=Sunxiuqinia dokdonensis TaxID=1409788 RepID=A0A0L8V9X3_9BACT|nr:hypothetical protein [Sunxiuqinia dokdonensis]KOH45012.1 hypothetical protein NC99_21370 [Sunxiuqinia dokdonensis]